ncbi:ankyrin repeat family protein [Artemisia annua]|uniref:Ankyrin repeat family protein n=1 Tax=Artemisia annua TaxID=35608 RepID=A0A2U1NP51_ARTAN|nr:ankyrin repeat family protein [Artemisia annua]
MSPDASEALAVRDKVQQFLNAAVTGNLDFLKSVAGQLDDGKGLSQTVANIKDANKRGALHFAAREGQLEVCKYLLEELKLDVNTKDEDGETPLIHAARQGHTSTAKYLIEHGGANPALSSELGATALHHVAGIGHVELMELLLSVGVDVDSQSDSGTPLVWAAGHAQQEAVKLLLKHKADPNIETDDGVTPLLSTVAAGSLPCLELLIEAGANVNITAGGATPLHVAADIGNTELITRLIKAKADPNVTDEEEGLTPVQMAAVRGNKAAVEILLPLTSRVKAVPDWTVDGIIEHMQAEFNKEQGTERNTSNNLPSGSTVSIKEIPEVTPEAKKKAAEAKSRADAAFKQKEYSMALDAYTQAIDFDPTDEKLYSNRSLCWMRLGQADQALTDARTCRELKPNWAKAWYREGSSLRLLQASNAFYEGVKVEPENMELVKAFREAVEAGRQFHASNKEN